MDELRRRQAAEGPTGRGRINQRLLKHKKAALRSQRSAASVLLHYPFLQPSRQILSLKRTFSKRQDLVYQLFLGVAQPVAVQFQKNEHDVGADALIPIEKGMISDKTSAKGCSFLDHVRIERLPGKRLERCRQRRIEKSLITNAVSTAKFFKEEPVKCQDVAA